MTVQVQSLSKIYGQQRAVNNISFSIQKGEVVGFLGPNGAGKSTTMKMLTCFIDPSGGEAWVCDKSIWDDAVKVRQKIGYLPEHNPLYLDMFVKEYLEFSGKLHGVKKGLRNRVEEMIELTGLTPEKSKKLKQLSKGYRQRAGLAQALLHNPEVLILDEPTSGLDPNQVLEIRDLIKNIGKEKTVILSTHIMQEVQAMCDRVIIINKGQIVADAPTESLLAETLTDVVVKVQFKNTLDPKSLKSLPSIAKVEGDGKSFTLFVSGKHDVREALFHLAVQHQNPILELNREKGNLESIFRQLTKKA